MKKNNTLYIIIAILVAITLIPYSRRIIFPPILSLTSYLGEKISHSSLRTLRIARGIIEIKNLKEENENLKKELSKATTESARVSEIEYENQVLKNQLGFIETNKDIELTPSKIIGREPTSYMDIITIDKGRDDGVEVGATVISDGALVGRVKDVESKFSRVILITSKDSVIQAMLQGSRVMGILKGGLSGNTLENIPQDVKIEESEKVITSGLGGTMKQGILIGEVAGQRSSKSEIFKVMNVKPQVDFSRLEIVFVIRE